MTETVAKEGVSTFAPVVVVFHTSLRVWPKLGWPVGTERHVAHLERDER